MGLRRTSPLPSSSSCIEEVTYGLYGRCAVKTQRELEAPIGEDRGAGVATGAAVAVAAAPPPPPTPLLNLKARSKAKELAEHRREVRIAGAPAAAEAAVARNAGGHSKLFVARRKCKAGCLYGEAKCIYWEIHARGIEWGCAEEKESLP